MSSSSVVALTPNCLIQLDKREIPEEVSEGTADPKDADEQRFIARNDDLMNVSSTLDEFC